MNRERLKGHLDMLLLSILEPRAAHGYAIIEELHERSGGTFDLPEGTVYPALHRLERAGLLSSAWKDDPGVRRRRVYEVTRKGHTALAAQRNEWQAFSDGVNAVLRNEPCTNPI
jgi:PadR family transcriptional regulator PadR